MEPANLPAAASSISNGPAQTKPEPKANGAPPAGAEQFVALSRIHESATNPRKTFNQEKLEELAQSMRPPGRMVMPMVVRVSPFDAKDYELIDGARRYRAAKIANLTNVPVFIVQMTDLQVLESQLITNAQHEDWPELEEAAGYLALKRAAALSVDQIAARVGKSRGTIFARLKLLDGIPQVQEALKTGRITGAHAILISRLQPKVQVKALEACFDWDKTPRSVRALEAWLDENVRCNLDQAPFKTEDAKLVPAAGACGDCEKREARRCLDPDCFKSKIATHVEVGRASLAAKQAPFIEISESYGKAPKGVIDRNLWSEVPAGQSGADVKRALVVNGARAGKVVYVKVRTPQKPAPQRDWEAERKKEEAKREREIAIRELILDAALAKVKAPLERPVLELILSALLSEHASDIVARRHGVETSERYDPKLAGKLSALVPKMKPQALGHLLIELALARDLEDRKFQRSGDPDFLSALAKLHKVNPDKIRAEAEREWKAQKVQPSAQPKVSAAGGAQ